MVVFVFLIESYAVYQTRLVHSVSQLVPVWCLVIPPTINRSAQFTPEGGRNHLGSVCGFGGPFEFGGEEGGWSHGGGLWREVFCLVGRVV